MIRIRKPPATLAAVMLVGAALTWLDGSPASAETAAAGNSIYTVHVEQDPSAGGAGRFAISTGPEHPAGQGLSLLYPGEASFDPGSYITVRSYTTGTDYVQSDGIPASGNLVVALDDYAQVKAIEQTGYRTTYGLPGPPGSAEALRIVTDIDVEGDSYENSSVAMTVTITNLDVVPLYIGVRFLLDLDVAGDDGPVLIPVEPASQPITDESSFRNPPFAAIRADDNSGGEPRLSVFTSIASDYPRIQPITTAADLVQYAYWSEAKGAAFDYETRNRDIATPFGLDDGALLTYFGASEANRMLLPPGESRVVSISMFATPPVTGREDCANGNDDDGDRLTDGEDADCQAGSEPTSTPLTPETSAAELPRTGRNGEEASFRWGLAVTIALFIAFASVRLLVGQWSRRWRK